jgi:hypothetical protein
MMHFCGPGRLVLGGPGGVGVWDCGADAWLTEPAPVPGALLVVTPDGLRAVVRRGDSEIAVVNLDGGGTARTFDWGVGLVDAAAVAPDGLTAAVAGPGGRIALFDLD